MTYEEVRDVYDKVLALKPSAALPWSVEKVGGGQSAILCDKEYFVVRDPTASLETLHFITELVNLWPKVLSALSEVIAGRIQ